MGRSRLAVLGGASVLGGVCLLAASPAGARPQKQASAEPPAGAFQAERQALVGQWRLNTALSDDPRAKVREAGGGGGRSEHGGGGGGWSGGGGGGGWGGGGGGGGRGGGGWGGGGRGGGMGRGGGGGWGEGRAGAGGAGVQLFSAPQITITNLTPEVTMLEPDGGIRRLPADDKGHKQENGAEVKTHWDEGRLIVETKSERGRVKETWTATSEPRHLEVLLEIDRPFGNAVTIKRVYDPVDPHAPKAEPAAAPPTDLPKP